MPDQYLVVALGDLADMYGADAVLEQAHSMWTPSALAPASRTTDPDTSQASAARKAVRDVRRFSTTSIPGRLLGLFYAAPYTAQTAAETVTDRACVHPDGADRLVVSESSYTDERSRRMRRPPENYNPSTAKAMGALGIVMILVIAVWVLAGCGDRRQLTLDSSTPVPVASPPSTTVPGPTDAAVGTDEVVVVAAPGALPHASNTTPPTIGEITGPADPGTTTPSTTPITISVDDINTAATGTEVAVRVDPPTTPPPDPCVQAEAYVNSLPYQPDTPEPVIEAYRTVASQCLGWTTATIDLYQAGIIKDIMPGESRFCWGLQRGQGIGTDCRVFGDICGTCSDTGFWQITRDGWGPRGLLCVNGFYCSAASIKVSPFHSMRSGLLLIMLNPDRPGQPWTWDADACHYHATVCRDWPRHPWVNL